MFYWRARVRASGGSRRVPRETLEQALLDNACQLRKTLASMSQGTPDWQVQMKDTPYPTLASLVWARFGEAAATRSGKFA